MVQKLTKTPGKTLIGLTGIFGAGKTTVAHFFEELGACIIDADKLAHEVLMTGSSHYEEIAALFPEACKKDALDREKIAAVIFKNSEKRKKLEEIVHPYVFERIMEEVVESEEKIVLIEVPLLFEAQFHLFCDSVLVVKADSEVIQKRLQAQGFSPEEIKARLAAQLSQEEKIKKADILIDNSGNFQKTRQEVEKVWKKIHTGQLGEA